MPEKFFIAEVVRIKDSIFSFALDFEAVYDVEIITSMACVLNIFLYHLIIFRVTFEITNITVELVIIDINRIFS